MATNKFQSKTLRALMACVFLASCGGGGDSGSEAPAPAPAPANYNVELYTGKTAVDYKKCDLVGDTLQTAGYFNLSKIAVYKDSIELLESFENCSDKDYYFFEIRTIKESTVGENYYGLDAVIPIKLPPTAKYPSGFYKISDNDYFVVGSAAARSNRNFELDEAAVAELNLKQGLYSGWDYFAHGFYRYGKNTPSGRILAAGASAPPVVVDGQGNGAQFYAPHDLEADAQGLLYTVDNGMVRTITRDYTVKTVPNAEVWVGGAVKALDADRAGMIHVLGRQPDGGYVWSRLMAGKRPEGITTYGFKLRASDGPANLQTIETFTVVGDSLLVARRNYEATTSELFRVWPGGLVEELTGTGRIAWPSTGGTAATGAATTPFPQVQHLEYGVDGHLYIVLPQGVLRVKDFK